MGTLRVVFLPLAVIVFWFSSCGRSEKEQAYLDSLSKDEPQQEAFNVKFMLTENAKLQTRLTAPHVIEKTEAEDKVSIFDKGLHLEFYKDDSTLESELTAKHGIFRKRFTNAEVSGNVVITTYDGKRMETEKLFWDREKNIIYTNQMVKIKVNNDVIYGDSLVSDSRFRNYKIHQFRGMVPVEDK